ncbi:MAG: hypothetical protein J3R72DRAFT_497163 [Linnemannia gamsii]|nr:MAG: hypothetical protein J3R72DRAFT_497163 [Linnemannia gamsii]
MAAAPPNRFSFPISAISQNEDNNYEVESNNDDSGYGTTHRDMNSRVPSLAFSSDLSLPSSIESTVKSLREQFMCTHPSAAVRRRRHVQRRDHPERVHPADKHVLPPNPEQLPLQMQIKLYVTQHHMTDIRRAITESNTTKVETGGSISRYVIRVNIDPIELLQTCSSLGNQFLCDIESIESDVHLICCQILQQFMSLDDHSLLAEQVRLCLRLKYLPPSFQECHLPTIASSLLLSREDIAQDMNSYSGFVALSGRVTSLSLTEHIMNYLHFTPSAPHHRVIKRTEDDGFMETGTDATLLNIDLQCCHCNSEMPESVLDRVYMKQQKISVECLNTQKAQGCFVNLMEFLLQDDLADTASLGDHIQLIGRLHRSFPGENQDKYQHGVVMNVNNVFLLPRHRDPETLPRTIEAIITSDMSPWNTSQAIVDLLDGIVPSSIYRKLKLALLLSESKNPVMEKDASPIRRSIHVLVVMNGRDTVVPTLMAGIASLKSCIFWNHGEDNSRKALYNIHHPKNKETSGSEVRASEISAAKDGIVLLELDQLHKKAQAHITPILTTANGIDIGIQSGNLSQQLDLTCCCWATHTSISQLSKKSMPTDPGSEGTRTGPAHGVALSEKFDIVVGQYELEATSDVSLAVASHTLRRCMQDGTDECDGLSTQLSREKFSQYLLIASTIQVRLSTECKHLLRAYFQVMRKKGSGPEINTFSSLSTMSTLLNVATCHAKICLRSTANIRDALVSIMMMEETIAARFGTSCLGFAPLLDGKENVTRLYAESEPNDVLSDQDGLLRVPVLESNFGLGVDVDKEGATNRVADTDVPMSLQDTRDQVMDIMHTHLIRVISEYADGVDMEADMDF